MGPHAEIGAAGADGGAQRFVAIDHALERALQRIAIERAAQA